MRQTNTKPTKNWKAVIFFLPMAVPVHGQLHLFIAHSRLFSFVRQDQRTDNDTTVLTSKQEKKTYTSTAWDLRVIKSFHNNTSVRVEKCSSWFKWMCSVAPSPWIIVWCWGSFIPWKNAWISEGCHCECVDKAQCANCPNQNDEGMFPWDSCEQRHNRNT